MPPNQTQRIFGEMPTPVAGGKTSKQKMLLIAIGILAVFAVVFFTLAIASRGQNPREKLSQIVAHQDEILRLIGAYDGNADTIETQSFLARTRSLLTSHSARLGEFSDKPDKQMVAQATNEEAEEELKQAVQNNRFEEVSKTVITELIQGNLELLQDAQDEVSKPELKTLLQEAYDNQRALVSG